VPAPYPAIPKVYSYVAVKRVVAEKWRLEKAVSRMGGIFGDGLSTTLSPVIFD